MKALWPKHLNENNEFLKKYFRLKILMSQKNHFVEPMY